MSGETWLNDDGDVILDDDGNEAVCDTCPCGTTPCSPCFNTAQNAVTVSHTTCSTFGTCGLVTLMPSSFAFCQSGSAEGLSGGTACAWFWAPDPVDLTSYMGSGFWARYLLVIWYDQSAGEYDGVILYGTDYDASGQPDGCDWFVDATPLFAGEDISVTCNSSTGKMSFNVTLTGQDSGWGGGDATGLTATIVLTAS